MCQVIQDLLYYYIVILGALHIVGEAVSVEDVVDRPVGEGDVPGHCKDKPENKINLGKCETWKVQSLAM